MVKTSKKPAAQSEKSRAYCDLMSWATQLFDFEKSFQCMAQLGALDADLPAVDRIDITIDGEIEDCPAIEQLAPLRGNPLANLLVVHIASSGGCSRRALELYAAIKFHGARDKVAIVDRAHSGAALVMMACNRRLGRAGATVMVHACQWEPSPESAAVTAGVCRATDDIFGLIFEKRTAGQFSRQEYLDAAGGRTYDTAAAINLGLFTGHDEGEYERTAGPEPTSYDITSMGGQRYEVPIDAQVVASLAKGLQANRSGVLGFPTPVLNAAIKLMSEQ